MHREARWVVALLAALAIPGTAAAERLAFVDVKRAVQESTDGKAALARLKQEIDRRSKEIEEKRAALRKLDEALAKEASKLKPAQLAKRREELQKRYVALQEEAVKFQRSVQEKEAFETRPILSKVFRAIHLIASRDRFTAVLRHDTLLWPQMSPLDITNEVIRKVNEPAPSPSASEPAPSAPQEKSAASKPDAKEPPDTKAQGKAE
jgi:outer membrane protein